MNRRSFLTKLGITAAVGLAVPKLLPAKTEKTKNYKWESYYKTITVNKDSYTGLDTLSTTPMNKILLKAK